jgi:hypothetical protein
MDESEVRRIALPWAATLGIFAWFLVVSAPSIVTQIEAAISLATSVVGFAMLVVGAFVGSKKAFVGSKAQAVPALALNDLTPAGLTAAVGALLLFVGQLA